MNLAPQTSPVPRLKFPYSTELVWEWQTAAGSPRLARQSEQTRLLLASFCRQECSARHFSLVSQNVAKPRPPVRHRRYSPRLGDKRANGPVPLLSACVWTLFWHPRPHKLSKD